MQRFLLSVAAVAMTLAASAAAQAQPYLGISARAYPYGGVKVLWVDPDSVANDLGLQRGNIIFSINGMDVNSGWEARNAIQNSGGSVSLIVQDNFGNVMQLDADLDTPVMAFMAEAPGSNRSGHAAHHSGQGRVKAKNVHRRMVRR
jgi:S1-C subfamily serine protease